MKAVVEDDEESHEAAIRDERLAISD
jgi:hypothetical protein